MRVLDVAPRPVFPSRRGSSVRVAALGRELSRRHEVRHLTMARDPIGRRRGFSTHVESPSQLELQRVHPVSSLVLRATVGFWHGAPILGGLGMRAADPAALAPLFRWADVVMVEHPWQFRVARELAPPGTPCVYSSMNVETDKFASWAEAVDVSPPVAAPWLSYVRRAERHAVMRADLVTTVSEVDRQEFIDRFGADPDRTVVVPNGVDTRHFRPATPDQRAAARRELGLPDRPVAIFQGSDHPANRAGLAWVRRLAAADDGFTFVVAGNVTGPERSNGLVAAGGVPDMRPYLAAADFGICPIAHGGGTKLKLIECLAAGLPTVSFPEGIRGIAVKSGEHAVVVPPDERAAIEALGSLAADPELARRMGTAARVLAEQRYDWSSIAAVLEDALSGLTRAR